MTDTLTAPAAIRAFYTSPGRMTALPAGLEPTPSDVAGVFALVQNLVMHPFWAQAYGQTLTPEREAQTHARAAADMLAIVRELDPAPLSVPRTHDREFTGNCRHHSVLASALLRRAGIPARARCGFGLYFDGTPVDHWVVEYWDGATWKLGDAQLDAIQMAALKPSFDPLDVPRDAFLVGGEAWRRCRAGEADPNTFGIMDMHGLWFVAGNLVRDIASLAGMEMLPWDVWGPMWQPNETPSPAVTAELDAATPFSLDPDAHLDALRALYERPDWRVPDQVFNAVAQRVDTV
jgi:Transglutaminase-like superfamily